MLRFRSSINGVKDLIFNHGVRQLILYSTSISTELNSNPNFVNYLVENLGFSKQQALSTSSKLTRGRLRQGATKVSDFNFVNNVDSVVAFLQKIGLQHFQIRNVVVAEPLILMCNVDKTLTPKTEGFQKLGFSELHIAEIVNVNPRLLLNGLDTMIIPVIEALREIMGCEDDVISVMKKLRFFGSVVKYLVPNVALLRSYGVSLDSIRKNLIWNPSVFTVDFLKDVVTRVEEKLGIPRNSPMFLDGIRIVVCLSDKNIESKLQVYKSFGWTDPVIATHISSNPLVLSKSIDIINKRLDFLMNEMGYEPSYLAQKVSLFTCSLEKRILPRHKVLLVLKENGLIKVNSLYTVVSYTESKFLKKYVLPFKEAHQVYSKFTGINLEMLTQGSSKPNFSAL